MSLERKAGRDPWSAADDLVLRKIAQAGLSGLTGMINGAPEPATPAGRRGPAIASAGEPASPGRSFAALATPTVSQIPAATAIFAQEIAQAGLPLASRP